MCYNKSNKTIEIWTFARFRRFYMELNADKLITEREMNKLFKTISNTGTDASVVELMLYQLMSLSGLRISEALNLTWDDIGEDYIIIKAAHSKNKKKGTVHIGKRLIKLLEEFKESNPYKHSKFLFNTQKGQYKRTNAHERLKYWLRVAGLRDTISCHSFRHTYGTTALDKGLPLTVVRDQLRHSSIAVTSVYLHFTKASKDKLKELF
jgi:integrase